MIHVDIAFGMNFPLFQGEFLDASDELFCFFIRPFSDLQSDQPLRQRLFAVFSSEGGRPAIYCFLCLL